MFIAVVSSKESVQRNGGVSMTAQGTDRGVEWDKSIEWFDYYGTWTLGTVLRRV